MLTTLEIDQLAEALIARINAPAKPLLSIKEAAALLGMSVSTVRGKIRDAEIPSDAVRHFGRRVMIDRKRLDRWIAAQ